jgi:hypothetical protein
MLVDGMLHAMDDAAETGDVPWSVKSCG